ncbi:transcriptional protein SWT1 isoform X2 [Centropristis striata]|uniref:transcriptional protein SWT1 isoform X2 n=1 Tax=Centropristis striata TaxID=184440 RepID=UPI0027E0A881|nr:transcriptional protein SWT1 isoform X2 [Centropristis striata]
MSKKSKKRKRRKLSSSSSEEDEKPSKEKAGSKHHESSKKKHDDKSQERSTAKPEKCAPPSVKDVSQSTRQIKKPVYRLVVTQATDQKPVKREEECQKTKSISVPFHGGKCSRKAKNDISKRDNNVNGSKTVEREASKSSKKSGRVPERTEKTSKSCADEKSFHRSPNKSKKELMSPSLVFAERKEKVQDVPKKKCRAEEPQQTENDSKTIKTKEPSETSSVSKDSLALKRTELFEKMCQKHEENKAKKSLCTEAKTPSAPTTEHSSTPAKHTTSVSQSNKWKSVTSIPGNATSVSQKTDKSSSAKKKISFVPFNFRIPRKVQPITKVDSTSKSNDDNKKNDASSTNRDLKDGTEVSDCGASVSNSKQETVQQAHSCLDVTPCSSSEGQDKRSSLSSQLPATSHTIPEPRHDQTKVVEELHLARSEKRLELNVMESYGELTCMDIDPPEEGAADTLCKQSPQQELIIVLDTNILLSHLDYIKKIQSHGLGGLGFPIILIPWVVLQELDYLKRGRGLSGSVAHMATPAISYIYNSLKSRKPHLWGQSMQQATASCNGLNAENNDDRVLQCCLQYQSLYPECAHILCTNDKNLCSKALLSGVTAFSKSDLEAEVGRSGHGFHPLQNIKTPMLPHISHQVPGPMQSRSFTPVQPHSQVRTGIPVEEKDSEQLSKREDEEQTKWDRSSVSELEECLREVLSDVLEVEMKAAFEDLWLEIVYIKPPWTLLDVLQCLKKHWIAVFGHIVPRDYLQTVLSLIDFFNSGKTSDRSAASTAHQEAKGLVQAFGKSSSRVPSALSVLDHIYNKLQLQWESPGSDVVMNDDDDEEEKQPTSAQVSHQEVWALFEKIWSNVCEISIEGFKALGYDPHTMQSAQPVGGAPPPQDALVCLHKLSFMVSQLLQAFSSVFSAPGLEEVQTLLHIIQSNQLVEVDPRFTARDLLDCFKQQEYREKLGLGGTQLMYLKQALDRCVETTSQRVPFTSLL